ncbi:hypothetical protein KCG44_00195 [Pacificimonas sp. WHA3]|uniref:Uncharacterized protein n=1 Tax=Pacificimonas pallii TaxID=2827236 RepID=A0ABS6SA06_9SPHN|nr:hypothetical protein [Pacificimonas pallii]MBV7255194.1 hypothetical protein [Pacificimonas pallii]
MMRNLGYLPATLAGIALLTLSACGDSDGAEGGDGGVTQTGTVEIESDFDASTMDVMNVDVAAGGIEPVIDPVNADAGIDMLGRAQTDNVTDMPPSLPSPALEDEGESE